MDLAFSGGVHIGFLFVVCLPMPSIKDTQYSARGSSAQSGRLRPHVVCLRQLSANHSPVASALELTERQLWATR